MWKHTSFDHSWRFTGWMRRLYVNFNDKNSSKLRILARDFGSRNVAFDPFESRSLVWKLTFFLIFGFSQAKFADFMFNDKISSKLRILARDFVSQECSIWRIQITILGVKTHFFRSFLGLSQAKYIDFMSILTSKLRIPARNLGSQKCSFWSVQITILGVKTPFFRSSWRFAK